MRARIITLALVALLVPGLTQLTARSAGAAPAEQYFPQTGKTVRGPFLDYWLAHGQLAINGYPITDEQMETLEDGKSYLVQWFERVRMEYHPEVADPQYRVLLGQFGRLLHPADPPVAAMPGMTFHPQTGHNVPPDFAAFWDKNGGLAQFGFPLSEILTEALEDGKAYQVQYFERARFERHPENAPPYTVLLGQFGRKILADREAPKPSPAPSANVILEDKFDNPASGWPQRQFPQGGSIGYVNGAYRIHVANPKEVISASHPKLSNLTDVRVEVDATKIAGADELQPFGIVVGYQDDNNYYAVLITTTGPTGYGIFRVKDGKVSGSGFIATPGGPIKPGNATNRIRVEVIGQALTLSVNGQKVAALVDAGLSPGRVWLYVMSGETSGVAIDFDNFVAQKP